MIRLKMTGKEIKGLSRFFQNAIGVARAEIRGAFDFEVYRVANDCAVNQVPWMQHGAKLSLKIAERHAHIDEFEKAQRKLLLGFDARKENKEKSIQLTKAACFFLLLYMARVEVISRDEYVNFIVQKHADTIMQNLM